MTVIELEPVDFYCRHCDSALEWTACNAPRCTGYRCLNCGCGCDLYADPDDGDCSNALARMPYALAQELHEERRTWRYSHPVRTAALPGECS